MIDWLIDGLNDWLIDWLIDWFNDRLVDWLIDWMISSLISRQIVRQTDEQVYTWDLRSGARRNFEDLRWLSYYCCSFARKSYAMIPLNLASTYYYVDLSLMAPPITLPFTLPLVFIPFYCSWSFAHKGLIRGACLISTQSWRSWQAERRTVNWNRQSSKEALSLFRI